MGAEKMADDLAGLFFRFIGDHGQAQPPFLQRGHGLGDTRIGRGTAQTALVIDAHEIRQQLSGQLRRAALPQRPFN